ncbi:transcriptional regulator [Albitalea terrae]|uniref:Transcriptional regulator n=1 Tax=Piscinibacter terrae TaxID=2496871 RepID=A0A3N7IWV0_9BURK|nr:transcriptional regulator [Albitalea terrae]
MGNGVSASIRFGHCELQPHERRLLIHGEPAVLGARAFDVLLALAQRAGELVAKNELMDIVWPDVVVEENNLQVQISTLRKLLGPEAIATIPGRGYRFTVRIQEEAPPTVEATAGARPSIAVLPFANLSGDSEQEYFADGLAEDIIASLARSSWLFVIARNSSFTYRQSNLSFGAICRELGVRYLVAGSVRRAGDKLRVSAELVDGARGETAWADRFDRSLTDLFSVQDEISSTIAGTIEPVFLRREETRAVNHEARDIQHWDLLMRARWNFWRSTAPNNLEARRLLEQALKIKPNDSASLALLSFTYMADAWRGRSDDPEKLIRHANYYAMEAVRNDDHDSYAHFTLGTALSCINKLEAAMAEQRRALDLYPNFAAAAGELGRLLAFSARADEAMVELQRAIQCSPSDPHLSLWMRSQALACFVCGEYEQAVNHAMEAVAKRPDWFFNYYLLAACQAAAGHLERAREAMEEGRRTMPVYNMLTLKIGHPFADPAHLDKFVNALRIAGWEG